MSSTTTNGITYRVSGLNAYVSNVNNSIILPDTVILDTVEIDGQLYNVTSIGDYAFYLCFNLLSITIPDSVTSIGTSAFIQCDELGSVTMPNSVTIIGDNAFKNCYNLGSITISESLTSIGYGVFQQCGFASITIPDSVTSIGANAFYDCPELSSVTMSNNVASIGNNAFAYCVNLSSITIPNSVTIIRAGIFIGCSELSSITIPNSVTSIEEYAFYNCFNLMTVIIENPSLITNILTTSFTDIVSVNPMANSSITFYNTTDFDSLSSTWKTIAGYYAIQNYIPSYNPSDITTGEELIYFLSTEDTYALLQNNITINEDLTNDTNISKFVSNGSSDLINITKI